MGLHGGTAVGGGRTDRSCGWRASQASRVTREAVEAENEIQMSAVHQTKSVGGRGPIYGQYTVVDVESGMWRKRIEWGEELGAEGV